MRSLLLCARHRIICFGEADFWQQPQEPLAITHALLTGRQSTRAVPRESLHRKVGDADVPEMTDCHDSTVYLVFMEVFQAKLSVAFFASRFEACAGLRSVLVLK